MGSMGADRLSSGPWTLPLAPPLLLLILLLMACIATALDIRSCNKSLGMESGAIADSAVNASSSYVTTVGPRYGRLNKEAAGGAWCPKRQIEKDVREWLQVDLGEMHVITGIETQGRYDHGRGQEYAEEYTVEYWRPGFNDWKKYKLWDGNEVLAGNVDTSTVVLRELIPTIFATQIRILPHSVHKRTVCLRIELKGCLDLSGVISYTIPKSPIPELSDTTYDGTIEEEDDKGMLSGGLGRLIDGETGDDNYKQDIAHGKGTGWIAWIRDDFPENYVEMTFYFDNLRIFDAVHIYTNNFFTKDIQVFERAEIWFGNISGELDEKSNVSYSYIPDTNLQNARNVSIALHGRQGKFLMFRLYFAARWIMISEVTFESWNPYANVTEDTASEINNEDGVGPVNHDADLNLQTITAREEGQEYVEVLIGVLTAITLLLLLVFIIILLLSRRQKLQSSPTVLKNPFGFAVNMKGFLLNLAPGRMLNDSGRESPDEEDEEVDAEMEKDEVDPELDRLEDGVAEEASLHESLTMEQFNSPLVESQYKSTYAIVSNTDTPCRELQRKEEMRSSKSFEKGYNMNNSLHQDTVSYRSECGLAPDDSPIHSHYSPSTRHSQHYRTLQNNHGGNTARLSVSSTPTHQRADVADYGHVKRWHTAPKEKHKVPAPVVRWNIAPSMNKPYKCKEIEPANIPGQCLHTMEKLGSGHIGEAIVCAVLGLSDTSSTKSSCIVNEPLRLAVARIPNINYPDSSDSTSNESSSSSSNNDTLRELRFLSWLSDPNLARILGVVCDVAEPMRPWTIIEYTELGDLAHYLQYSEPLVGTQRPNCSLNFISQNCLLYMGTQIASAMRYLESKHLVHKDLAARNCLLGRCYTVKVTDIAMCSDLYKKDYSDIGTGRSPAPIRWLPWESILLDRYTCSSTVWSFAVTLWEVMSFAREKPFQHLTNEQVIQNAELMYYGGELQVLLPKPMMCPEDVYKVMCSCWKRDETIRPNFKEIYAFLKNVTADYRPGA